MAPPSGPDTTVYGEVFKEIERRLWESYRIQIKEHLGEMVVPDLTGKIDPSAGGMIKGLGSPHEITLPGKRAKFIEGKTNLIGITFPPKNFQVLLDVFRSALTQRGETAFHYHPLKPTPGGGKINNFLDKAEQFVTLNWLSLSYDQTTVGLTKAAEERAWGFREIADSHNTEVSPIEAAGRNTYSGENRHSVRFGQSPGAYARKVDITSLHVALTPAACNIHIDNVGFVLRGPRSVVGLDPDFIQHIINELVWKTILRDAILGKYGESAKGLWAIDHLSLMLPSSDNRYAPTAGVKLDLGSAQLTAAFTLDCKCLQSERLSIDEKIVPMRTDGRSGLGSTRISKPPSKMSRRAEVSRERYRLVQLTIGSQ